MSKSVPFNNDGFQAFVTAKGYALITGKPYSTIKSRVQKGDETEIVNHPQTPDC